jgi:hypothetical protein
MLKVFFICNVVMAPYKKLVKIEAQAQVEEHLSSSNAGGSAQVGIGNAPHNSSCLGLFTILVPFVQGINLSLDGQLNVQMTHDKLNIFLIYSHSSKCCHINKNKAHNESQRSF